MKNSKRRLRNLHYNLDGFYRLIATGLYVGYIPPCPGTYGALQGILLYTLFMNFHFLFHGLLLLCITFLGVVSSGRISDLKGEKDPDEVIVDEIAGAYLAVLGKTTLLELTLVFIVFRIIDIAKPFPMRKIEALRGGWGIMFDDLFAGIITNLVVTLLMEIL